MTNFQSKRKTPTSVAFYRDERLFGSDATALQPKKPEVVFSNPFRMIGRTDKHPLVTELGASLYAPYEMMLNASDGKGILSIKEANDWYTPEELTAMILVHAKDMTDEFGGQHVKDIVVTVPSTFTQHEREGVYAAASIAGLNILSLIEENTAAALQYGIDQSYNESKIVMFYNMGATTTQVSIVKYSTYYGKESKTKAINQFEVIGKGWDAQLGGLHIDVKLAEELANRFNKVWNEKLNKKKAADGDRPIRDIKQNLKVMNKLRLEAKKIKEVLSVNSMIPVKMEQLHDDLSLHTQITRDELEALCEEENIFNRAIVPIQKALDNAGISLSDVFAVEVLGGGFRVPRIKRTIEDYFKASFVPVSVTEPVEPVEGEEVAVSKPSFVQEKPLELGQHLNSDESMVLGAAFRGANLSTAFRVRKIGMVDTLNYGVMIKLSDASVENDGEDAWKKQTTVFPAKTALSVKPRTVAFNYNKDISCDIVVDSSDENNIVSFSENADDGAEGGHPLLASFSISGIEQFVADMEEKGHLTEQIVGEGENQEVFPAPVPRVHLTFALDSSSAIVYLSKAEMTLDVPKPAPPPVEPVPPTTEEGAAASEDAPAAETAPEPVKKKKAEKSTTTIRRALKIEEHRNMITPNTYSDEGIRSSKDKLQALIDADNARKERESALNDLEAYIYKIRNSFRDNDATSLAKVVTAAGMEAIIEECNELEDWLYDEGGRSTDTTGFRAKKTSLMNKVAPMYKQVSELTALPSAISKARATITDIRGKVSEWELKSPHILANETELVLTEVVKYETWLDERIAEHEKISPYVDEEKEEEVVETPVTPDGELEDGEVVLVTKPKRLASDVVKSKLKPVLSLFKKTSLKPVPKVEKVCIY